MSASYSLEKMLKIEALLIANVSFDNKRCSPLLTGMPYCQLCDPVSHENKQSQPRRMLPGLHLTVRIT